MSDKQLDYLKISVLGEDTAMYGKRFLGQHGVSYLLQARTGQVTRSIIVDVGQSHKALMHNMSIFGVKPVDIDMIVMTHCHYDHTEGLSALLNKMGKKNVPVICHPDIFKLNFRFEPYLDHRGMALEDQPQNIAANGGQLFLTKDPLQLIPGLTTTGEVPRATDFEDTGITLYTIRNGSIEKDTLMDDISVVANVKNRGIVVITGCSHAGIINIVNHAMAMFPEQPLDGVVGGFHLIEASNARIQRTVEEFVKLKPRFLSAGHCTGFKAQMALAKGLKNRFVQLTCGLEFIISSG